jgi:ABC-type multidrug transport system ATPase subunit
VAESISKSYDSRPIVRKFSTRIMRGDRVGIIGPNGAGKTTLLNLLIGALAPDAGEAHDSSRAAPPSDLGRQQSSVSGAM